MVYVGRIERSRYVRCCGRELHVLEWGSRTHRRSSLGTESRVTPPTLPYWGTRSRGSFALSHRTPSDAGYRSGAPTPKANTPCRFTCAWHTRSWTSWRSNAPAGSERRWAASSDSPPRRRCCASESPRSSSTISRRPRRHRGLTPDRRIHGKPAAVRNGRRVRDLSSRRLRAGRTARRRCVASDRRSIAAPPARRKITTHFDPAIARAFDNLETVSDLWDAYDTLSLPVCLLRGERSDIASAADARRMSERGPMAQVHELPAIGHAPWLDKPEQIDLVRDFFSTHF